MYKNVSHTRSLWLTILEPKGFDIESAECSKEHNIWNKYQCI